MLMGDLITNTEIEVFKKSLIIYLLSGLILLVISLSLFNYNIFNIDNLIIMHMTAYAGYFILFSILFYLTDIKDIKLIGQTSLIRWGKMSFSLYYLHFIVLIAGLIIVPFIITDFSSNGVQIYQYFIIVVIFLIIIELFLRLWERYDYVLGIEWFINKISKKSMFVKEND